MAQILLVEDDTHISSFIVKGLKELGHTVECVDNATDACTILDTTDINLAIVDIMIKGDTSGLDLVAQWRGEGHTLPIIFLSARDRIEDKVKGFNIGGDDYLSKPFSFIELRARIDNLLRRVSRTVVEDQYEYGGIVINIRSRKVFRDGKEINLQRREYMLLEYFMQNPEQVLGKAMILERVWGFDFDPQTNVVDVLVSRLRTKIDKGFTPTLIHTVRGMGYVFQNK